MRAKHCECELVKAGYCEYEFEECWAL